MQAQIHVPVHVHGNHWVHVTITLHTCADAPCGFKAHFQFDDPLFGGEGAVIHNLKRWLCDEFQDKDPQKRVPNMSSDFLTVSSETPCQTTSYDCGGFMNQVSHYRARGLPLSFTQCDMTYFRRRMVWEILNCQLLEDIPSSAAQEAATEPVAADTLEGAEASTANSGAPTLPQSILKQPTFPGPVKRGKCVTVASPADPRWKHHGLVAHLECEQPTVAEVDARRAFGCTVAVTPTAERHA